MNNLEEIWRCEYITNEDFKLRRMNVIGCERLVNLFPSNPMPLLCHLEELEVHDCASIETLFDVHMDWISKIEEGRSSMLRRIKVKGCERVVNLFPSNPMPLLCHLEELEVVNCASIETLFNVDMDWISNIEEGRSSMLRRIKVMRCNRVVNLFPSNPMPLLCHLEELEVHNCDSIERLFDVDMKKVKDGSSCMLKKIEVSYLIKLKEIWRVEGLNDGNVVISGFEALEYIRIRKCEAFKNVFSPLNASFNTRALMDIYIDDCGEYKRNNEHELDVAFPSSLMHNFHHLHNLRLRKWEQVEVVFKIECRSKKELAQTQPQVLLPYLKDVYLEDMKRMTHVWKCNWNELLILQRQHELPFCSLTTIELKRCNNIKYLFSPLMVILLSNLKKIKIQFCDCIEEVVSSMDDNDVEMHGKSQTITTLFPHLDSVILFNLKNLKRIDGGGKHEVSSNNITTATSVLDQSKVSQVGFVPWSLCQYPRQIFIYYCPTLSSAIPSYALGRMQNLEELTIGECDSMIEVFQTEGNNDAAEGSSGTVPKLGSPRLKNINAPKLLYLKEIRICNCVLLQHVFTFSALESLKQLEKLSIERCWEMKVIVKEENFGEQKEDVVFSRLKSIVLRDLPNLEGFFFGMNAFQWESLESVKIKECPRIRLFTAGRSTTPKLDFIHTSFGKHSLEHGLNFHVTTNLDQTQFSSLDNTSLCPAGKPWSFDNLVEIDMRYECDVKHIIPSNELPQLQKLEKIRVRYCDEVKEIFEVALEGTNSEFNESRTAVEIPNLREVELRLLINLKYIWKSNEWAVLQFPNLTRLYINDCKRLKHVFTCSMAVSLSQLQELELSECDGLEVIVKEEEEEECDGKNDKMITLPCLKLLKLYMLSSLEGFYLGKLTFSLPLLDTLDISFCDHLTVFTKGRLTTPNLNAIKTPSGWLYVREDLNSFMSTMQQEGFKF